MLLAMSFLFARATDVGPGDVGLLPILLLPE